MNAPKLIWLDRAQPQNPLRDLTQHVASDQCWCQPRVTYTDPVTGNRVLVHNVARPVH